MATFLKESLLPTLIILAAAALVVLVSLPLAQTDWADGMRTSFEAQEGGEEIATVEGGEAERGDMGVFNYIAPLIKVTILMGIGGLLTMLALGVIKLIPRMKRPPQHVP